MRIPRIFTQIELAPNREFDLEAGPSHHLLKVLRMAPGRALILFDGRGGEYPATLLDGGKKVARVATAARVTSERESPLATELAIGISRGDRMDWLLQKATELGVSRIVPLFAERSEVKLSGERLQKKMDSWHSVVVAACEQCQRNTLPQLHNPLNLPAYLASCNSDLKLVLHHRSERSLAEHCAPQSVSFLIGPEGGLSDDEISQAMRCDFHPLTIGPRVLRTETAPLVALALLQHLWGDF